MMIPFTIHTGGTTKFMETPTLPGVPQQLQRNQNAIIFFIRRKKMSEIK